MPVLVIQTQDPFQTPFRLWYFPLSPITNPKGEARAKRLKEQSLGLRVDGLTMMNILISSVPRRVHGLFLRIFVLGTLSSTNTMRRGYTAGRYSMENMIPRRLDLFERGVAFGVSITSEENLVRHEFIISPILICSIYTKIIQVLYHRASIAANGYQYKGAFSLTSVRKARPTPSALSDLE